MASYFLTLGNCNLSNKRKKRNQNLKKGKSQSFILHIHHKKRRFSFEGACKKATKNLKTKASSEKGYFFFFSRMYRTNFSLFLFLIFERIPSHRERLFDFSNPSPNSTELITGVLLEMNVGYKDDRLWKMSFYTQSLYFWN